MATSFRSLELGWIHPNPNNNREMDSEQIEVIKESIIQFGLLHMITVYEEGEDNYIIVSGHKRFEALKRLGRPNNSTINCEVIEKPEPLTKELELLTQANIARKSTKEIQDEVIIASQLWDKLPKAEKEAKRERFKEQFISEHEADISLAKDASEYINKRFRPRLIYIKKLTGLDDKSNKTISNILKKVSMNDDITSKPIVKKARVITAKCIIKTIECLQGQMEVFKTSNSEISSDSVIALDELNTHLERTIQVLESEN